MPNQKGLTPISIIVGFLGILLSSLGVFWLIAANKLINLYKVTNITPNPNIFGLPLIALLAITILIFGMALLVLSFWLNKKSK